MSTTAHTQTITLPNGKPLLIDLYVDDGGLGIWFDHPETGVRVGVGTLENDERQPYVAITTESATSPPVGGEEGEPHLAVSLNDADLYDVERAGPTPQSQAHRV